MKQHPIPQHIASYQFHLIGEMTLKQFLELISGLIASWIIYSLNLPWIIKWPFVLLAGLTGVALAFLPIKDRPLDRWFISFFKAIYSPTQYLWKKKSIPLSFLQKKAITTMKTTKQLKKKDKNRLEEYLETIPPSQKNTNLDKKEFLHLKNISSLLGITEIKNPAKLSQSSPQIPSLETLVIDKIKIRKLGPKNIIAIPKTKSIKIEKQQHSLPQPATEPVVEAAPHLNPPILVESSIPHKLDPAVAAQFSTTLPIPRMPEAPNIIVGMVLTYLSKIVPGALIEIINQHGETVRALKSNKLGQFFCASPLKNGRYKLKIEHPLFKFDTIEFKAENKVVPPIKIKAKKIEVK